MPFNSNHDVEKRSRLPIMPRIPQMPAQGVTDTARVHKFIHKPLHPESTEYIQAGSMNHIPQFNSTELAIINHLREHPELMGGGAKKFFKNLGKSASKGLNQVGDALKHSATDKKGILRNLISSTLDVGAPLAGVAAATALGGNPVVGVATSQILRKTIKGSTGYGVAGVGEYRGGSMSGGFKIKNPKSIKNAVQAELNKAIDQYLPEASKVMGSGVPAAATTEKPKKVNTSRTDRNAVVKRVMQERGVSLPAASKIVKAENLYKK